MAKAKPITLEQVKTEVEEILASKDPESAHAHDDVLRERFISWVAKNAPEYMASIAKQLLRTRKIERYYA